MLKVPDLEDFTREYIPGMRSGQFSTQGYLWPSGPDGRYGQIPVLLYREGELVNLRFTEQESLSRYAPASPTPDAGE